MSTILKSSCTGIAVSPVQELGQTDAEVLVVFKYDDPDHTATFKRMVVPVPGAESMVS